MKSKLLYLLSGTALGAGGHYAYKYYNPQRNINSGTQEMVSAFVSRHKLEHSYVLSVLKSVTLMLKGFYYYGMDIKIRGFNFHSTYVRKDELENPNEDIKHIYCIFSPTEYLCSHPEIQHGGAVATVFDQNMGELAILFSRNNVATKTLTIDYKRPVKKGQFYVLEARITESKGRKIWIKAAIKQLQTGQIKAESEGLFLTVNWDNQMTKIIGDLFQTINFKNYKEQHNGVNVYREFKQKQIVQHHLSPHISKQTESKKTTQQSNKSSRQKKLEEIRSLKQSISNRAKESKEHDEKIQKLTALVERLEKSQKILESSSAQNIVDNIGVGPQTHSKADFVS